jgi:hypothetical protein
MKHLKQYPWFLRAVSVWRVDEGHSLAVYFEGGPHDEIPVEWEGLPVEWRQVEPGRMQRKGLPFWVTPYQVVGEKRGDCGREM